MFLGLTLASLWPRQYHRGMSTQQEAANRLTTADLVAGEVRAQMARRNLKSRALVPVLGLSQGQVSQRINGHIEWRLSEIDVLADFLGCDPSDLLVVRREGLEAAQFLRDPQPTGCRPRHLVLVPQLSEVA